MAFSLKNKKTKKQKKKKEKNGGRVQQKPPLVLPSEEDSYFTSVCKTRFKLPKILLKAMQKTNHIDDQSNANCKKRKNTIGAIISGACGSKRTAPGSRKNKNTFKENKSLFGSPCDEIQVSGGKGNHHKVKSVKKQSCMPAARRDTTWGQKVEKRKDDGEEDNNRELELCKKRILMGEKCRPLNPSGTLQYDDDGILLPEDDVLPSKDES